MPLTAHELQQLDRAQQRQLDHHLDALDDEPTDEEDIDAYYDAGDARYEEQRDRDAEED